MGRISIPSPWVGRISCRCGTKVSSQNGYKAKPLAWAENPGLPYSVLRTKTLQAWLPKEDNKLAGVGTKSSLARTIHCVVVVHSWLLQGLISYEWGTSLADVGQRCQAKMAIRQSPWPEVKILNFHTRYWETKSCGLDSPKKTISLQGLEQNPPLQEQSIFFLKKEEYSKFLNIKNMKNKFKLSKERLT